MIPLPPGCKVNFSIYIDIECLTEDMIEWYKLVGGEVILDTYYDARARKVNTTFVRYGRGKRSYKYTGSQQVKIHFNGEDASIASLFVLKYLDLIINTNLQKQMEMYAQQHGEIT
jgi:hypothetical protein